jgi:hypothetical protein
MWVINLFLSLLLSSSLSFSLSLSLCRSAVDCHVIATRRGIFSHPSCIMIHFPCSFDFQNKLSPHTSRRFQHISKGAFKADSSCSRHTPMSLCDIIAACLLTLAPLTTCRSSVTHTPAQCCGIESLSSIWLWLTLQNQLFDLSCLPFEHTALRQKMDHR